MKYLPKIALGAWAWGNDGTFGSSFTSDQLRPIFEAAMKNGLNLWDTASDGKPEHFDVERPLRYILPMLEAIREKANIRLMLSRGHPLRYSKRTDKGSTGANASRKT